MLKPRLRDFGIYLLPDGNSYVAVYGGGGSYYLFDYERGAAGRPVFKVSPEGRVGRWLSTGPEYCAEVLEDTGETFAEGGGFGRP